MSPKFQDFSFFPKRNALLHGDRMAYAFTDGDDEVGRLTFVELDRAARAVAVQLRELGLVQRPVLLLLSDAEDFVRAFLGCLYAGAIAVPVNLPRRAPQLEKILLIASNSGAQAALTTADVAAALPDLPHRLSVLEMRDVLADAAGAASHYLEDPQRPEAPAFLQYTSGSTGRPKGVVVTHGNLIANQAMICEGFGHDEQTVFASWLPLFHDMGLVGTMLQPVYLGIPCTLMPPMAFVQSPVRWLRMITDSRATTSGGPNFAYELCVQRVSDDELEGLDLSSWKVAFNGAEPIRAATVEGFQRKFAACGLRPGAHFPCYGMAEATLFVSGGSHAQPPRVREVSSEGLEAHVARPVATEAGESARPLVSCGWGHLEQEVVVVDPQTGSVLDEGRVGEIWLAGPNVAGGYWHDPERSAETFEARTADGRGPFLRTGDLGFVDQGELYVTGRIKDLIIISGKNHYPHDIELTVGRAHRGFGGRPGAAVALTRDGSERLAVVQEIHPKAAEQLSHVELSGLVRDAVAAEHGLAIDPLVFIRAGELPMTTSGKVQRSLCAKWLLEGRFEPVAFGPGATQAVELRS